MPTAILPLPSLIRASAWDAGNMSMRKAGRTKWSRADWNAAAATQDRLRTGCYGNGPEGCIKFQVAEALEREGYLSLHMTKKEFFERVETAYADATSQTV